MYALLICDTEIINQSINMFSGDLVCIYFNNIQFRGIVHGRTLEVSCGLAIIKYYHLYFYFVIKEHQFSFINYRSICFSS